MFNLFNFFILLYFFQILFFPGYIVCHVICKKMFYFDSVRK